jgi:hypothetical protein
MDSPVLVQVACCRCHAAIDDGDRYCRYCGEPVDGFDSESRIDAVEVEDRRTPPPAVSRAKSYDTPWAILSLLFLGIGPFAIPLLWRSQSFSPFWKKTLTALVLGLTALLVLLFYLVIKQLILPLRQVIDVLAGR